MSRLAPASGRPPSGALSRGGAAGRRAAGIVLGVALVLVLLVCSVCIGSRTFSPVEAWQAVTAFSGSDADIVMRDVRIPRSLVALLAGAGISVAGCVIQAATRNPLGDPGILGVNAGAGIAVAVAVGVFGVSEAKGYIWFAFAGALLVSAAVYLLSAVQGRGGQTSHALGLTLAGVAIAAVLSGSTLAMTRIWPDAFDQMRNWESGSLSGRDLDTVAAIAPAIAAGVLVALFLSRRLDAIALGDHIAVSMGIDPGRVRLLSWTSVSVLSGASVAAAGPIGFIGLIVPHAVRRFTGPHEAWLIPCSALYGASLMLAADIVGRTVIAPSEIPVGVITAVLGGTGLALIAYRGSVAAR
ncbi:FecCD family ABC transporter permease [Leucobacter massiliensis]|uniref:Iron ABC transporter permease n=1 Tax=Leucobacter massiliensis TaxID=1686285 RepID=A0A2S9QLI5_9MICO|nr:iron ABC transporter permease [Leucobacter massiliensis]PRI10455.1 hypothetical protein B4915_11780 [Leucobacter massiliensis]